MNQRRYYGLSDYFKEKYGVKCFKLAIDGGFTCPNRDGTLSTKGCAFCSESGSGEFSGVILEGKKAMVPDIDVQITSQIQLLSQKWSQVAEASHPRFIGYFQNYTNTYKPIDELERLYTQAMKHADMLGLAIATRPDCISEAHIKLFKKVNVLWVELGLQTVHDDKAIWMNRHYDYAQFLESFQKLSAEGIAVVVHLMVGLPGESKDDFLESVKCISNLKPFGVKFHALNVLEETALAEMYRQNPFELLTMHDYIDWIVEAIALSDEDIVMHRLTGDGEKNALIAPRWILNKRAVLNGINKSLAERNIWQGKSKSQSLL